MKYIVILGDGMSDLPLLELGNKTPLDVANKPNIDMLAKRGELGLVKTVPDHLSPPGSDIANLSVLGYDPDKYYTGRAPLEAVAMGIDLKESDLAIRCNLVTLSNEDNYYDKTMLDYSSDEISSEEAAILIHYINEHLSTREMDFYPGVSYRHCLVWDHPNKADLACTPPHDILTKKIKNYLPKTDKGKILLDMMVKSHELLKDHPINLDRIKRGLNPANSIWLWGEGRKPYLSNFRDKYNLDGAIVSAVDLLKGLGICAGLRAINIDGATGTIDTNFDGKAKASIDYILNEGDFLYLHIEAPDECGHRYEIDNKVKSIEIIDKKILAPILQALNGKHDFRIMVLPDHPTPLSLRTHTHDPVPYIIYDSRKEENNPQLIYSEADGKKTGIYIEKGHTLMDRFILNK